MDNKPRCEHNVPAHLCPECGDSMGEYNIEKAEELKQEFIRCYAPRREITDGGQPYLIN
ncbi:unnamed protein product, partial [marine sediment metagenome]